jgi:hypothetical protein
MVEAGDDAQSDCDDEELLRATDSALFEKPVKVRQAGVLSLPPGRNQDSRRQPPKRLRSVCPRSITLAGLLPPRPDQPVSG